MSALVPIDHDAHDFVKSIAWNNGLYSQRHVVSEIVRFVMNNPKEFDMWREEKNLDFEERQIQYKVVEVGRNMDQLEQAMENLKIRRGNLFH